MIARIFLAFNAFAIALIALFYLYDPNLLLARYGLETGSAGMDNMLRSTYGGLYLASAAIFAIGAFRPQRQRDALIFVALFMGGNALGRTLSILLAGWPPASILPLLWFEIGATAIALVLIARSKQR